MWFSKKRWGERKGFEEENSYMNGVFAGGFSHILLVSLKRVSFFVARPHLSLISHDLVRIDGTPKHMKHILRKIF